MILQQNKTALLKNTDNILAAWKKWKDIFE